jgi:PIN domain nuclease of toxin-antitoxin system
VKLVTDTHALVWYLSGTPRRLSRRAHRAFVHADAGRWTVHVPTLVMLEIVLLEQLGRLRLSYRELREQLAQRPGFPIEALTADDVDEARSLRAIRDPFDRAVAATAVRLGAPLITCDDALAAIESLDTYW